MGVHSLMMWLVEKGLARRHRKGVYLIERRAVEEVEVYVAVDGSEVCLSLNPPKAFCAQNGAVKETRLGLAFSRYEVYEEKMREVYRPKGLLAYTTAAKEYVRLI